MPGLYGGQRPSRPPMNTRRVAGVGKVGGGVQLPHPPMEAASAWAAGRMQKDQRSVGAQTVLDPCEISFPVQNFTSGGRTHVTVTSEMGC